MTLTSRATSNEQRATSRSSPAAGSSLAVGLVLVSALAVVPISARADDLKVTHEMERAVSRGLEYLARTQKEDGSWPDSYGRQTGVVGLCVIAFLAHGETPGEGKYGKVITRAVDYILKQQQSNGLLSRGGSAMYNHGFATLALSEVYGVMDDKRIGPALKKASGLAVSCQNRLGGWRYSVGSSDADTTVTGAQMVGLRAAAGAGMEVPVQTIKNAVAYYKRCFCSGGGFGYTSASGPNDARSGIGLLVLGLCGEHESAEAKATADWILARLRGQGGDGYFYYGCYYRSQAMYQAGGKYWREWNKVMTPGLISLQREDGSWPSGCAGATGSTAFALLSLEINYNYLPIYQR